jgi:TonB family protein
MSGPPEREVYRNLSSATDRFKREGRARFVWSTLAAVGAHALLFFGSPSWITPARFEAKLRETIIEWVVVTFPSAGDADVVEPELEGDSLGEDVDVGTAAGEGAGTQILSDEDLAATDALREVLLSRAIVPTLVQPESVPTSLEPPAGSGSVRIEGGGASTVDLQGLAAADSLALDLLNALRPELVVLNPSSWILIRNPTDVENFMRLRAAAITDVSGRRSTSVALWIDESGSVEWAEVSQSSGRTDLDELALELFSEVAAFRPARDHGVRVPTTAIFTVHFPW